MENTEALRNEDTRPAALQGDGEAGEMPGSIEPTRTVGHTVICAMVRAWAGRKSRTADEAAALLQGVCDAMLSPRERAQRVDAAIVRRLG